MILKEVRESIQKHVIQQEPGTWLEVVITQPESREMAFDGRLQLPFLDTFAPDHPVILAMGGRVLNSSALNAIEEFWGGQMPKDTADWNTGFVRFHTEIIRTVPIDIWMEGKTEYLIDMLIKEMEAFAAVGLTTFDTHIMAPHYMNVYGEIARRNLFPIRFAWVHRAGILFNQDTGGFYRRLGDLSGVGTDFFWNVGVNIGHLDNTGFLGPCTSIEASPEVKAGEGCNGLEGMFTAERDVRYGTRRAPHLRHSR